MQGLRRKSIRSIRSRLIMERLHRTSIRSIRITRSRNRIGLLEKQQLSIAFGAGSTIQPAPLRNHSAAYTWIATRLRTQRAGVFSPETTNWNGALPVRALPSSVSATITSPSCTSGVISPIEYTTL